MESALRLINVTKVIGPATAVADISLSVSPGEVLGLVGPDGSGKTTLARLAAGVLAPTSGRVEPESRGRVGYLSGRFSLYPELTVWENLTFFAKLYGMKPAEIKAEGERLLGWMDLLPFTKRLAGALSGGMRQKLALACAIVHKPPMLILDEPTTAVDPVARANFWALLKEQAQAGRAVLVTTPYLDEAQHCDRVALLNEGRLMALDTVPALRSRLPYRMALLTPGAGQRRGEMLTAAEGLAGVHWNFPTGLGVRVALDPDAALNPPPGFGLTELPSTLEDVYIWLSTREAQTHA
jgi:ABC-2 type transport system ATP-binding protein